MAGVARKVACGLDFRSHRAHWQVHASQLVRSDLAEAGLVRRTPVGVDTVDIGGDHKQLSVELLSEQCRSEVLVDDGLDAVQRAAFVVHRRYATAAGADHDRALLHEAADRTDFEDPLGLWAGHHTAELVAVRRDGAAARGLEALRGL